MKGSGAVPAYNDDGTGQALTVALIDDVATCLRSRFIRNISSGERTD